VKIVVDMTGDEGHRQSGLVIDHGDFPCFKCLGDLGLVAGLPEPAARGSTGHDNEDQEQPGTSWRLSEK